MVDSDTSRNDREQLLGSTLAKHMRALLQPAESQDRSRTYVYRGQANAAWPLQSAAVRRLSRSIQRDGEQNSVASQEQVLQYHKQDLLREFRDRGHDIVNGRRQSDLECLSTLQHQGAATGLLDFSYSPLVALWFASGEGNAGVAGRVFKMDITTCQTDTRGDVTESIRSLRQILDSLRYPWDILAWQPPSIGESGQRVIAQQSIHLLCRHDPEDQGTVRNRHLTEFDIAAADKERLREDLRAVGVDEKMLFPDLRGFAAIHDHQAPLRLLDSRELLSAASVAYSNGEFDIAADRYRLYLDTHSDDKEVKLLLTNVMVDAQHPSEASDLLAEIEAWVETALPVSIKANFYFNKANVAAQLGDHAAAIESYTTSVGLSDHAGTYFNRANSYASIGRYDEAIADYESCPHSANALFNAGNAHMAKLAFEAAEQCFAAAAQLEPTRKSYTHNLNALVHMHSLIEGRAYTPTVEYRTTGTASPTIIIWVEDADPHPIAMTFSISLMGNSGNKGNAGYLNLPGGQGFDGSSGGELVVIIGGESLHDRDIG